MELALRSSSNWPRRWPRRAEYDEALATVDQAVQTNPDELIYRPAVFRLRGELRLRADAEDRVHFDLAEQDFRKSIEVAQSMNAGVPRIASDNVSGAIAGSSGCSRRGAHYARRHLRFQYRSRAGTRRTSKMPRCCSMN